MSSTRWQRLQELFEGASRMRPEDRPDYLGAECAGDADLRAEVESLLRHASATRDRVAEAVDRERESWSSHAPLAGRRIGSYVLTRELGHGGMGVVYLATRSDDAFRKEVAIKLIRIGADDPEIRHRFRIERQILANLEHPNIARLLDGGTADDGLPYVVMERVEGEPIDAHCDRLRLSVDDRLRLFRRVCEAVHFAHRNLIVHRDIKPGNILITADGTVKLLDFGIAKLLDASADPARTDTGLRPMTPEFASPEQVRGGPITTASDVYSLGVLLYVLLTGQRPYTLVSASREELERVILTREPERPSMVVGRATDAGGDAAVAARGTTRERLRRRLRGDLDTIVACALRKDPERRYASVEQLSDDVRRHLEGRPVTARPDTFRYRIGKFARRNRAAVSASAAALLLIIALSVVYAIQLVTERDRARLEAAKAEQVADFLVSLFEGADPSEGRGRDITARELLERGASRVDRELARQPAVRATMLGVIGRVYGRLGLYREAAPFVDKALTLRRDSVPDDPVATAAALYALAVNVADLGDYARGDSLLHQALDLQRRHLAFDHEQIVWTLHAIGRTAWALGDLPRAERALREALALARVLPPGEAATETRTSVLTRLGQVRSAQGAHGEAEMLMREALAERRRVLGGDHPSVGETIDALAETMRLGGKLEQSIVLFREAVAHGRAVLGETHSSVISRLGNLSIALGDAGQHEEAIATKREVLANRRATLGPTHTFVASALNNLAASFMQANLPDSAEGYFLEALSIHIGNFGEQHPSVATTLTNLAQLHARQGDHRRAMREQRRVLEIDRELLGEQHPFVGQDWVILGRFTMQGGRIAEAEAPLRRGVEVLRTALGPDHRANAVALHDLGKMLVAAGRFEDAEPVAREATRIRVAELPVDHWERGLTRTLLGEVLAALGRVDEAEPLLVDGYRVVRESQPAGAPSREEARGRLVRFYEATGRRALAVGVP